MQLRDTRAVVPEGIRIASIGFLQSAGSVHAARINRSGWMNFVLRAEQPKFWIRRRLELIVRVDAFALLVIDRDQLHLIEVGNFVQFLRDVHLVFAVRRFQSRAGYLNVLVVIHGEVMTVARTGSERSNAKHIGYELEFLAVPGKDHRTRAGEPLRLGDYQ